MTCEMPQERKRNTYNGHPSRNYWNVALWLANDEGLYRLARECILVTRNRREAAELMLDTLKASMNSIPTTPDGAPYTVASIRHGMRGMY